MVDLDSFIRKIKAEPEFFLEVKDKFIEDKWSYNILLNTYEYMTNPPIVSSIPIDVFLPIVSFCNANCVFCKYCNNYNYYLPVEKIIYFRNILKFVRNFGFNCYGEPLLHPDFDSLACEIRKYLDPRATTYLVTNGILLSEKMDMVKKHCDSINISLNAATPETYLRIMRIKDRHYFYKVVEAIKELKDYKKKYNSDLFIQISFCVTSLNFHELPIFIELGNILKVDRIIINPLSLASKFDFKLAPKTNYNLYKKLSLMYLDYHEYRNTLYTLDQKIKNSEVDVVYSNSFQQIPSIYEEIHDDSIEITHYNCSYLYQRMMVNIDINRNAFYSRLCCYVDFYKERNYINGNIYHSFNNKNIVSWRHKFKYNPTDICKKCIYFNKNLFK